MLNLFLALLLSSFGAESLKSQGEVKTEVNKLQEAVDRIMRGVAVARSAIVVCFWGCVYSRKAGDLREAESGAKNMFHASRRRFKRYRDMKRGLVRIRGGHRVWSLVRPTFRLNQPSETLQSTVQCE